MVLAAQELLVVVHRERQADLVARGAELGGLVQRLEEGALVEGRLRLHELFVDEVGERVGGRESEGIVDRLLDGVVAVPGETLVRALQSGDRVARRAGDAGQGGRMVRHVELRVVERTAEERCRIVAAGAPARRLDVPVALERDLPGLVDGEEIERVVERAEVVRRMEPRVVGVLVALEAVLVVHQRRRRDEVAGGGPRARRVEIFLALFRGLGAPLARIVPVHRHHPDHHHADRRRPRDTDAPLDPRSGQPVQDVEPDAGERGDDMRPVRGAAEARVLELEALDPHQRDAREEQGQRHREQRVAHADRPPARPVVRVLHVDQTEHDHRQHDQQPEPEMREELELVEIVLVRDTFVAVEPGEERDAAQIDRVRPEQREQAEHDQ